MILKWTYLKEKKKGIEFEVVYHNNFLFEMDKKSRGKENKDLFIINTS